MHRAEKLDTLNSAYVICLGVSHTGDDDDLSVDTLVTYVCVYVCMYVRMYVCMYVCMYMYVYVCMYEV